MKDKKAISLMVSYTLLVVIAISLSIVVYAYLKLYLPAEKRECQQEISLAVENAVCTITTTTTPTTQELDITISNRGLFSVSAMLIRIGPAGRTVKIQVNQGDEPIVPPLAPGKIIQFADINIPQPPLGINLASGREYEIEVQPALIIDGFLVPCEEAVVVYPLECT